MFHRLRLSLCFLRLCFMVIVCQAQYLVLEVRTPFLDCADNFDCSSKLKCETDVIRKEYVPTDKCIPADGTQQASYKLEITSTYSAKATVYTTRNCDTRKVLKTSNFNQGECEGAPIGLVGTKHAVKWVSTYSSGGRVPGAAVMWFPGSTTCASKPFTPYGGKQTSWPFTIRVYPRRGCQLDTSMASIGGSPALKQLLPQPNGIRFHHINMRQHMQWECDPQGNSEITARVYNNGRRDPSDWRADPAFGPTDCRGNPHKIHKILTGCQAFTFDQATGAQPTDSLHVAQVFANNAQYQYGCGPQACDWEGCEMVGTLNRL